MNLVNLLCVFVGYYNDPVNGDNEVDNEFPLVNELLAFSSKGISIVY